jgi:hypothetical protein
MPTRHVCVWANDTGVGVSQWAADTSRIWHDKGGLNTHRIETIVRERICEIAQAMSIINEDGAGPEHCDLLIDCCITRVSDLVS